ncbi:MAG: HPr family phosphocarrier protein [Oscillospiraceae bacterium]|nr:HPr family phosphocarrier protein [Oscillospiraceae bacterium]
MKTLEFTINDKLGIHARPAGMLVKKAKEFQSEIIIQKDDKSVNATKLMALMGMNIKHGDKVTVTVNGADEEAAAAAIEKFFADNL